MSETVTSRPKTEMVNTPSLGEQQATLGREGAKIFRDFSIPLDSSAEIVLRNPAAYSRNLDKIDLPEILKDRWIRILNYSDYLTKRAAKQTHTWEEDEKDLNGLEKLRQLVGAGNINSGFRDEVAGVMEGASELFAESIETVPGDTKSY